MRMIGITGGVGSGKSQVLSWLREHCQGEFLEADRVAHRLMARGGSCYAAIVELFGRDILGKEGEIDRKKMGSRVFQDGELDRAAMAKRMFREPELRKAMNGIIHPAVRTYILQAISDEQAAGRRFFFLEAALLIEEKYDEICDELWYVYAEEAVRRERLKKSRGYSDEKIDGMLASQLPEEEFRKHCCFVLDNSGDFSDTAKQLEQRMKIYENV